MQNHQMWILKMKIYNNGYPGFLDKKDIINEFDGMELKEYYMD